MTLPHLINSTIQLRIDSSQPAQACLSAMLLTLRHNCSYWLRLETGLTSISGDAMAPEKPSAPTGLSATKSRNPRRKADAAFEAAKHTYTQSVLKPGNLEL